MDDQSCRPAREDSALGAVIEDLEQQAAGMLLAERDAELADRSRGEYAGVDLASRLHASLGRRVMLVLQGGAVVEGTLRQAGADWCLVEPFDGVGAELSGPGASWLVRTEALLTAGGLSGRAVPEAARPVTARLRFGSALHRWAEAGEVVVVELCSGSSVCGRLGRIGADFAELRPPDQAGTEVVVPFPAISGVRRR